MQAGTRNGSSMSSAASALLIACFVSGPALGATSAFSVDCTAQPASSAPAGTHRDGCAMSPQAPRRTGMRMSNRPSDGRTGGTPETSARVPGGPPDDANAGLTFVVPDAHLFSR